MTFLKTAKKTSLIHRNIVIHIQFPHFPALTTKKNPKKTSFLAIKHDKKKHGMAQNDTILKEKKPFLKNLKKVLKKRLFSIYLNFVLFLQFEDSVFTILLYFLFFKTDKFRFQQKDLIVNVNLKCQLIGYYDTLCKKKSSFKSSHPDQVLDNFKLKLYLFRKTFCCNFVFYLH